MFSFYLLERYEYIPSTSMNTIFLRKDNWDDYTFETLFFMTIFDEHGERHEIGGVKIGYEGQEEATETHSELDDKFSKLDKKFFSLGDGPDYYKNISKLGKDAIKKVLAPLNDLVINPSRITDIEAELVLNKSLLRNSTISDINGQFKRLLYGLSELSNFKFSFNRIDSKLYSDIKLGFDVKVDSLPSTNIHALIGRNGCGKTSIINGMVKAITDTGNKNYFFTESDLFGESRIDKDYFRTLISVSFSAFDPFSPPRNQTDPTQGTQYYYIGLKNPENQKLKSIEDLRIDFITALVGCLRIKQKKELWINAIEKLSSDKNFSDMQLKEIIELYDDEKQKNPNIQVDNENFINLLFKRLQIYLSRISSGHAIVLFTITRLIDAVGEKSLVLIDEPEVHLHPPLLSAFLRALSDLLYARNGVAVIATHSPVVLQEIPKSCVWKILRSREAIGATRPDIETFGENIGVLTREVFSLEVTNSGYHDTLRKHLDSGISYEKILSDYRNQIGSEGRAVLKAMVLSRSEES